MKPLNSGLAFVFGLFFAVSATNAAGPPAQAGPSSNANARARVQPQIGHSRLTSQATPHASSPASGRGRSLSRVTPTQRLARRQRNPHDASTDPTETDAAEHRVGSRDLAKDAPRIAMTRALSKRLSQIDKIRDKALEAGDLGLLELADELELRARRKFDDMAARMDQRSALGKPGVGPPVLLPAVDSTTEPEPSDADQTSDQNPLAEIEVQEEADLPDESTSDSAEDADVVESQDTTQE